MRIIISLIVLCLIPMYAHAQARIGTGAVQELYNQYCMACHGPELQGGLGPNLLDDEWIHGSDDESMTKVIREGVLEKGMVPYGSILSDEQIRSLIVFIREMGYKAKSEGTTVGEVSEGGQFESQHHSFELEKVVELQDDIFWSVSFLPCGTMLLSKFGGGLYTFADGKLSDPIEGTPEIFVHGQGGQLEVQAHPDFAQNGWIYMAYAEKSIDEEDKERFMTAVIRGRIKDGKWVDQEDIFRVPAKHHAPGTPHYGTRFVFKDGYLFFGIGDRGLKDFAQDLTRPNGKIYRIFDDGRIPDDNPFVDVEDAYKAIWSFGHRNPQGLDMNPSTGEIWETEHGPRGGDELNRIKRGANFGWPVITYGMNYNGTPITDKTEAPGMEQPVHYWLPSIAVCGIDFYEGDRFPKWTGDLFVGGMAAKQLERFKLDGDKIVEHEIVLKGEGRVRDVSTGPDGLLYVVLNVSRNGGPGAVYKLVPVD